MKRKTDKIDKLVQLVFKMARDDAEANVIAMLPYADRMAAIGVPEDDITKLGYIAIRETKGTKMSPAEIMRDFTAVIEAELKTSKEIIQHYERID